MVLLKKRSISLTLYFKKAISNLTLISSGVKAVIIYIK